ncbi:hypothetical protein [Nocardioides ungokensis]|uniref:hypothetical protein n=1 Tax=Nocardioides ungokensis TaxID=1643322 RepID=UPI0015E04098|nr:hypothetical protein [Nocardioides ungokensis]
MKQPRDVTCDECGRGFEAVSPRARFCSPRCRKASSRRPSNLGRHRAVTHAPESAPQAAGALVAATAVELTQLGQLDSVCGRAALALAYRIESPIETGSAAASMTVQLSRLMGEARTAATPSRRDAIDQLTESIGAKVMRFPNPRN